MNKKKIIIGATLLYIVLITLLSTINLSQKVEPVGVGHLDKMVHFGFYFTMNFMLMLVSIANNKLNGVARLQLITLITILYSIGIEIVQIFVGRHFELLDIAANSAGAITALIAIQRSAIRRYINRRLL